MAHLTGPVAYPGQTSETQPSSEPKIALGTRARDAAGNEFIRVDFNALKALGELVTWNTSFLTADLTATSTGPLGVVVSAATSSDLHGWLQIYGYCAHVLAGSGTSAGAVELGATTDGYSVPITASTGGVAIISGMTITSPVTATSPGEATTASSALGVSTAMLNYPFASGAEITS